MEDLIKHLHPKEDELKKTEGKALEIKLNKKTIFTALAILVVAFMIFQLVELVLLAQALKTGTFCK